MSGAVEEARLAFDLAKLELAVQQHRSAWEDDKIDILDIAAVKGLARRFGVSEGVAYIRAKSLGLLSYQAPPRTGDA